MSLFCNCCSNNDMLECVGKGKSFPKYFRTNFLELKVFRKCWRKISGKSAENPLRVLVEKLLTFPRGFFIVSTRSYVSRFDTLTETSWVMNKCKNEEIKIHDKLLFCSPAEWFTSIFDYFIAYHCSCFLSSLDTYWSMCIYIHIHIHTYSIQYKNRKRKRNILCLYDSFHVILAFF